MASRAYPGRGQSPRGEKRPVDPLEFLASARVEDMEQLAGELEAIGHKIDVIFGEEVFNELVVDVDYPGRKLAFLDRSELDAGSLGKPSAIVLSEDGQKEIMVSINGLEPAPAMLDTGSGDTITLFRKWSEANNLLDGLKTSTRLSGGVGGNAVDLVATVVGRIELLVFDDSFAEHRR